MKITSVFKPSHNILNKIIGIVKQVEELESTYRKLEDIELKQKTHSFLKRIKLGESVDDLIVEALAVVREACYRVHNMFAYSTQLISALVIYGGNFAEMKTGEGKTLTIVMAAYIGALEQQGVHVVTVNEYLVKRDSDFCRKALNFLGITVGFITPNLPLEIKKKMYDCHVTYTTNSELAFDYLRDNMVYDEYDIKIPKLHFAIIDEGDSILIDEARTPLIISGPGEKNINLYVAVDQAVKSLEEGDYKIDLENKNVSLQSTGILKIEKIFGIEKLYTFENSELIHKIQNSLFANYVLTANKEYIVDEQINPRTKTRKYKIIIVDKYTGRLLYGQTYGSGLHQAIQAKEYIEIEAENKTTASITYQSFFRLYKKIAALSGTAISEEQEFSETYNMIVVTVPTYKPLIRKDLPDIIFGSKESKIKGIVDEIKRHYIKGQPVLVGTSSVDESEEIYREISKFIDHSEILNATNHYREGQIIAKAGKKHSVTIATNIAGRGVDIKINDEVRELGGLFVLGTDRNESRRIDNQLRGRSGRQGDPGKSIFFISLEDEIFKRFGGDKFEKLSKKMKDEYFDSKFISKTLTGIQKKIQSLHFEVRKKLIEYNDILSKQQQLVYKQRRIVLLSEDNNDILKRMTKAVSKNLIEFFTQDDELKKMNLDELINALNDRFFFYPLFFKRYFDGRSREEIEEIIYKTFSIALEKKSQKYHPMRYLETMKKIIISKLDWSWQEHLEFSTNIKTNIHLYSFEQKTPLNVYIEKLSENFEELLINCGRLVIMELLNLSNKSIGSELMEDLQKILKKYQKIENKKSAIFELRAPKMQKFNKMPSRKYEILENLIENSHN